MKSIRLADGNVKSLPGARNEAAALRARLESVESRTAELESFVYSVTHDLKAPLRTIQAFSNFLLDEYGSAMDERGLDYLGRLVRASSHLGRMISELQVLTEVGRQNREVERVEVGHSIHGILELLDAQIRESEAEVILDQDLLAVFADSVRVDQIFFNLVSNSLKYNQTMPPRVEIGIKEVSDAWVTYYVKDNGIGIAPEYQEKIFEAFQRLHSAEEYEGTGLGLAIVKRAVDAIGGEIKVASTLGQGATFSVRLPLAETRQERVPQYAA